MLKSFATKSTSHIHISRQVVFITVLLWLCQGYLYAQKKKDFPIKNEGLLQVTSYLPNDYKGHAQNWSFAQDERGVMYVGNMSGVLQYDGNKWRRLPIENYQVAKSKSVRIYTAFGYLEADSKGHLQYKSLKNLVPEDYQKQADLPTQKIIVTSQLVAFHKTGYLFIYKNNQMDVISLSQEFLRPLMVFNDELFMTKRGTGLMKLTHPSHQHQWQLVTKGETFADKSVTAMLPYRHHQKLIATYEHGLYLINQNEVTPWDIPANSFLQKNQLSCAIANGNKIMLGTEHNGVLIIDQSGQAIQLINQRNGISSNYVHDLFIDKDQALWLALDNGIARVETNSPFSLWNKHLGLEGSVNHIASQLYKDKFYVGTSQGVFYRANDNYINPISPQSRFKLITATKGAVFYLLATPEGVLCAHKHGIFLIKDTTATQLVATSTTVYSFIYLHTSGNRYILASTSKGLLLLEKKQGTWVYKQAIKGYASYNRYMHQDKEGNVWVTTVNGIYRLTLSTEFDQVISKKLYAKPQGLPQAIHNRVFGLNNHQLVAGTTQGVYLYNSEQDKFLPHPVLTQQLGLCEYILWIKEDSQQNIWLWTKAGVIFARKDARQGYVLERKLFNKYKELFANYMAPHVIPIDANNVLFETREGVVHYNSQIKELTKTTFQVLIRNVKTRTEKDSIIFGGNFTHRHAYKFVDDQPAHMVHALPYRLNNLCFSFAAVYFEETDKIEFQYFLEGFNKKYVGWSTESKKEYTNLPAGEYVLRVKARNVYGQVSAETTYRFKIAPPWYQTLWAYLLFGVVGALVIWGIVHLNIRRLSHQKAHLEQLVNERTLEIRQKNTTLQTQKNEISEQAKNLTEQAHFLREANEEIIMQRDQLDQAYKNVKLLSEIGKEITATFSIQDISQIVYKNIQYLLDTEEFGIGLYLEKERLIAFDSSVYKGDVLPSMFIPMNQKNRFVVHCVQHQKEIVIGDVTKEYRNYIDNLDHYKDDILLRSLVCLPLMANNEAIGVVSVQSSYINAYSDH
ncbi:triple tyrosine motif-containing protein [uncultured Microscilla sp.]|uniref:triple tyrosine motif-containing protein n=1 Tax=uncultured Microscilla sp. TaxID=432653 RepID=UPI002610627C|nr:triple tyrosine motif-containing protein [uncultured Microscilla sp.]